MTLDLNDLAPAPWTSQWQMGGNGHNLRCEKGLVGKLFHMADLEFVALARNAFAGDPEALVWWEENRVKKESQGG